MAQSIKTLITLEGAEKIKAQLQGLGTDGAIAIGKIEDAANAAKFEGLAKALDAAKANFKEFGDALGVSFKLPNLKDAFSNLAESVSSVLKKLAGLAAGFIGLGFVVLKFVDSASSAIRTIAGLGTQTGTTVEQMSGMVSAFAEIGVGSDDLIASFRRLSVRVQTEWPAIQKSIRDAANTIIQDQLSIRSATLALDEAENTLLKTLGLRGRTGFQEKQARIEQADLAVEQAKLRLSEARQKQLENEANSIPRLVQFVDNLVNGISNAGLKVNASAENIVKGIIASTAASKDQLGSLSESIGEVGLAAPEVFDVLLRLSAVFQSTGDESLKTAIAFQLFGRNVSQSFIRALSQGPEALKKMTESLSGLGLAFTEADAAVAKAFRASQNALSVTADIIKNKIAILFAPLATSVLDAFRDRIIANFGTIKGAAESLVNSITPLFQAIINTIRGVSFDEFAATSKLDPATTLKVGEWQVTIDNIKKKILKFANDVIEGFKLVGGFIENTVLPVLEGIARSINKTFGTKINGEQLGIALIVGHFLGLDRVIIHTGVLLASLAVALKALAPLLVPLAFAAAGFVAGFKGMELVLDNLERIKQVMSDLLNSARLFGAALQGPLQFALELKRQLDEQRTAQQKPSPSGAVPVTQSTQADIDKAARESRLKYDEIRQQWMISPIPVLRVGKIELDDAVAESRLKYDEIKKTWAVQVVTKPITADDIIPQDQVAAAIARGDAIHTGVGNIWKRKNPVEPIEPNDIIPPSVAPAVEQKTQSLADRIKKLLGDIFSGAIITPAGAAELAAPLENIGTTSEKIGQKVSAAFATARQDINTGWQTLVSAMEGLWQSFISTTGSLASGITNVLDGIITKIQEAARQMAALQAPSPGGSGGGPGFAGGGLFRGRPGRDTNLAWLTDREYVMRQEAVNKYGVGFMHLINSMRLPIDAFKGFALGGLVNIGRATLPAFANGGLNMAPARSGRNITLVLDGRSFGMSASDDVGIELERFARSRSLLSAGRPPSRIR